MAKDKINTIKMQGSMSPEARDEVRKAKYFVDCLNKMIRVWKRFGFTGNRSFWASFFNIPEEEIKARFVGLRMGSGTGNMMLPEQRRVEAERAFAAIYKELCNEQPCAVPQLTLRMFAPTHSMKVPGAINCENDVFTVDEDKIISSFSYELTEAQSGFYQEAQDLAKALNQVASRFPLRNENKVSFHGRLTDLFRYGKNGEVEVEPYISRDFWKVIGM